MSSTALKIVSAALWVSLSGLSVAAAEKPNILFLFADDQCFDTIRELGNDEIETPHLDRLVREGATFTHCYNMGGWNGAICVASRTMLNTGRFLWQARDVWDDSEQERAAGRFWSEYLKAAGYRTYFTGKWHVKANPQKAFDVVRNVRGGMPNQTPEGYNRPLAGQPDPWSPDDPKFGGFWAGGTHWSEVVANDTLDYLAEANADDAPFFMYIAFNAPHDPRQSPREYVDRYPPEKIRLPVNFLPEYPHKDGMGCSPSLRDEALAPFPRTARAVQVHRQEYYAIITHMDAQIGRILDALEESGQRDNTWIFFTADHGLAVGQHGLIGKQNMYDHSVRVPLMVVAPDVVAGRRIDAPVYLQDIMPTTLELAGVEKPAHVQFHSLLPLLKGEGARPYDAIYGGYIDQQRMVLEDGYKLILYPRVKVARLYHVAADPHELRDLIDKPASASVARRLFRRLLELQEQTGDTLDLEPLFPRLAPSTAEGSG